MKRRRLSRRRKTGTSTGAGVVRRLSEIKRKHGRRCRRLVVSRRGKKQQRLRSLTPHVKCIGPALISGGLEFFWPSRKRAAELKTNYPLSGFRMLPLRPGSGLRRSWQTEKERGVCDMSSRREIYGEERWEGGHSQTRSLRVWDSQDSAKRRQELRSVDSANEPSEKIIKSH
ncbi:uncharacterized protein V6R79_018793 [Siganus canaliculatus]